MFLLFYFIHLLIPPKILFFSFHLALAAFFTYMTIVIDGGDWAAVKQRLRTRYLQTLVVNYAVWPTAQFINFLLLPSSLQVPFASTIGVFWNAYLSLKNAGGNR